MDNLDLNNFELFLKKSGYITKKLWTSKNSDIFYLLRYNDILLSFEYNHKISTTEASVKYGDKIQWINKIFKTDLTFDELHSQYIHYTSTNISAAVLSISVLLLSAVQCLFRLVFVDVFVLPVVRIDFLQHKLLLVFHLPQQLMEQQWALQVDVLWFQGRPAHVVEIKVIPINVRTDEKPRRQSVLPEIF